MDVPVDLDLVPAVERPDLLAEPVAAAIRALSDAAAVRVAEIDPELADTAEFVAHYGVSLEASTNCVIITGKRGGEVRYAACLVVATTRADVNGVARRMLDVRKASFADTATATGLTGMAYGGITPLGLPADWPLYVDPAVHDVPEIVLGSGVRKSKLWLPPAVLSTLPNAVSAPGLGR